MEIIYKGTMYQVPMTSPSTIDAVRLYNLSTKTKVAVTLIEKNGGAQNADGMYEYEIVIDPSISGSMPVGVYNLELISAGTGGEPIIVAYYENYAKVKESSWQPQS